MGSDTFCSSPALRNQWFVVAEAADIADQPVAVGLLGERFVVWRTVGGGLAAADRCPHREAPLSLGRIDEGCLVCPYHGWTFAPDGSCVAISSSGPGSPIVSSAHLSVLSVRERYGLVWLCPGTPAGDLPEIPQDRDATYWRLTAGVETWQASATRMVDNFCDVAHFPYVHAGTIGADTDPVVAAISVEQLDADFTG